MVWNEETIRHLRDLWTEGHSTAEIGRRLGVSKNAIVGKAHRLDLDARPSPIRREAAKPAADRQGAYPRLAGPTLPPLASASLPPPSSPAHAAPHSASSRPAASAERPLAAPRSADARPPGVSRPAALSPAAPPGNVQPLRGASAATPVPAPAPQPRPAIASPPVQRRSAPACCWPIGEPGTKAFRFCDDTSLPGKPYCDEHARVAYVRIRDRKEDAA
jgi:GcrA cell cycle regulator